VSEKYLEDEKVHFSCAVKLQKILSFRRLETKMLLFAVESDTTQKAFCNFRKLNLLSAFLSLGT
jgi:hypothetical protein